MHTPRQQRLRAVWELQPIWLSAAIYSVLAVLLTWPLTLHVDSAYPATPGQAPDLWQNLWDLWWAGEALRRPTTPFFTDMLFFPRGASLLFHPLNLTGGLLALVPTVLFGPVAAYNILVLLSFSVSGVAVATIARRHGCRPMAALLGGLIYSASTFHMVQMRLGHLEQLSIQWLPLYALALDDLLAEQPGPRLRRIGLALLSLLLVVFTSLYMALFAALLTLLWGLIAIGAALRARARDRLRRQVLDLTLLGLLALMLLAPSLLIPMLREQQQTSYMLRNLPDIAGRADPLAAVLQPPPTYVLRKLLPVPLSLLDAFLGYLPLLLALIGSILGRRAAARWLVLAV